MSEPCTGSSRHPQPRGAGRLRRARLTAEDAVLGALRWVVIAVAVAVTAGPLLYGISLSLRPFQSVVSEPLNLIPDEITFDSYPTAMAEYGLGGNMWNSLQVALATAALAILFSVLGAYAAVRLRFFGRNAVNVVFLGVYLLPGIVLAVPLFVLLSRIGLTGSLVGLVFVYVAQTVPVALYMLRTYLVAVPSSVEEAAMIDGCGRLALIRRVVLPLALPGVAATALYVFMIAWNEYLFALLFLVADRDRWTVSLGIAQLTEFSVPTTVLMAGSIAITVPVVAGFFLAQRLLVTGLTSGAEKG
ncbi:MULTISPECIES: carbohydrate ABC transporter permease [Glycomyces]|uniref:Carbohydrate ABC transporter permease n=2 Tax=Glycomyces TaxID=58113 RepID=A0A9X3SX62_9ACTN|nr:carbohydrate ABC transporter permease [Glycomyces lechevalierae]MDA1388034.1 carbohydrate ABC transporter permease [Glycomyces lechevalierae]MDR7338795.1 multiple sugar transport system permease protein [Glycomyces lechevalierae]